MYLVTAVSRKHSSDNSERTDLYVEKKRVEADKKNIVLNINTMCCNMIS